MNNKFDLIFNNIPTKELVNKFIMRFLKAFPFLMIFVFLYFILSYQNLIDEEVLRQELMIDYASKSMENEISRVANDIFYISNYKEMELFNEGGSLEDLNSLNERLISFAEDSLRYDQIRMLDLEGNEINRINRDSEERYIAVDKSKLQNKSDRYYFKESINLLEGDIYISPFDLNMENGEVELPYKPVIRFAISMFNSDEEQVGILIINYLGDSLLEILREEGNSEKTCIHLTNNKGEYLYHSEEDYAWGFMFGKDTTLHDELANVYEAIENGTDEVIEDGNELHVYKPTISNGFTFSERMSDSSLNNIQWYIISGITTSVFAYISLFKMLSVSMLSILILALIMWFRNKRLIQVDLISTLLNILYNGIERSPAVFVLTNKDGDIVYVNRKFEEVTKYKMSEVIGENPRILKSDELSSEDYKDMWDTITRGDIWEGEFHNKTKEGKYYWANAQISAINENDKLAYFLAVQEDITELKDLHNQLEKVARIDDLTNVFNKRYLTEVIENVEIEHDVFGEVYSMLMLDIDFFKTVNDKHGHPVGDEILKELTHQVNQLLRSNDIQFRYGGEEFLILLPDTDIKSAKMVAERIRSQVESHSFETMVGKLNITISIGCCESTIGISIEKMIIQVDKALYRAKESGRNRVEVFDSTSNI